MKFLSSSIALTALSVLPSVILALDPITVKVVELQDMADSREQNSFTRMERNSTFKELLINLQSEMVPTKIVQVPSSIHWEIQLDVLETSPFFRN